MADIPVWVKGIRITYKDLKDHVGLGTNASTLSWTKFIKTIRRQIDARVGRFRKAASADEGVDMPIAAEA